MKRFIPSWPFPPYIFIPGSNPHPKKVGGHMEGLADPKTDPINILSPQESLFLRYSLDLYNHGYFWEAHVYFEALWNAHNRKGCVADFLKGMIKLSAAGVKLQLNQRLLAHEHFMRAKELLEIVSSTEGEVFLGFNLTRIITELKEEKLEIQVFPDWV